MTAEELSALHKNFDEAIANAVKQHQIAIDDLTEQQVVHVFKEAIACGDISINVVVPERFGQIRQGAMYIPFAEKERLESRIKELERDAEAYQEFKEPIWRIVELVQRYPAFFNSTLGDKCLARAAHRLTELVEEWKKEAK